MRGCDGDYRRYLQEAFDSCLPDPAGNEQQLGDAAVNRVLNLLEGQYCTRFTLPLRTDVQFFPATNLIDHQISIIL